LVFDVLAGLALISLHEDGVDHVQNRMFIGFRAAAQVSELEREVAGGQRALVYLVTDVRSFAVPNHDP